MTDKELTDEELEKAAGALQDKRASEPESDANPVEWPTVSTQKPTATIKGVGGLENPEYGGA